MIKSGLEDHGIQIKTHVGLSEIKNNSVLLSDETELNADMVLLSIGTRPELALAKASGLKSAKTVDWL